MEQRYDSAEAEVINKPFGVDAFVHAETGDNEVSRLQKLGSCLLNLPSNIYEKIQYAAVAVQNDPVHYAKRGAQSSYIAFEASTLNEAARYAVFGWAHTATDGNSVASGLAFGLATFAIEAPAALIAADVLDGAGSKKVIEKINTTLDKLIKDRSEDKEMSVISQAAVAMLGGTAVLLAAKQRKNPERTKPENQKFGLKAASIMSAYFTVEETVVSEAVNSHGWPKTIAAGLLAGFGAKKIYDRIVRGKRGDINQRSKTEYVDYRNEHNQALCVGIFGDDLERAQEHSKTVNLEYKAETGKVKVPALVPVEILEWYNKDLLARTYGEDAEIYCYVHPPITSRRSLKKVSKMLRQKLDEGCVIITERYKNDSSSPVSRLISESDESQLSIEAFGGDIESRVDFFAGTVEFNGKSEVKKADSWYDVYDAGLTSGEFMDGSKDGASLVRIIEGDEAEAIWDIYEKPFEGLGKDDPTLAGFDKESLLDILRDPDIVKVINRVDGAITTLMIFLSDFDKAPWFNKKAYQEKYPEYVETDNILIFPGIVSDENKRGNNYAMDVIDLATRVAAKRGTNLLITFECTEVSTKYIPEIVENALEHSGVAKVTGMDEPIGAIEYYAISKS